ncbi:MAG: calcium/sodium antiporter [Bacteriovorax sp.]|nr:calcium/sodium antiporter [Bacteriovorax sp.]
MLLFWIIIFIVSLAALVKGADWLLVNAEKIGLSFGLSPFLIGVVIVGVGTSFPELISSSVAVFRGVTEVPIANAVGSNIANILLIVGISAVIARKLVVTKNLIDLDLPLLSIGTVLLLGTIMDRQVTRGEAILLVVAYLIYLLHTILHKEEPDDIALLPSRKERRKHMKIVKEDPFEKPKIGFKEIFFLILGIACLVIGAKYLIEAMINLSTILNIATGVITITAVAFGTSLPELMVSVKAAWQRKSDVALGNIFGSNVFNALVVVGFPGLFKTLTVDEKTFLIGVPAMALATLIFVISGISRKIHIWEGLLYLVMYALFIVKLFGWF